MLKTLFALALAAIAVAAPAQSTRFSVVVEGQGPDVIVLPALTSGRRAWDASVASLSGRYRVHRVQIGGFAGEPAGANRDGPILAPLVEDLHAYIVGNRLQRPAVVGHSLGGLLALMLAARHPDDVGRAMIVDALPFYGTLFDPAATAASVEPQAAAFRDSSLALDDATWRARQRDFLPMLADNSAHHPLLLEDALTSDRGVVARAAYEDMVADLRPAVQAMRMPITVLVAMNAARREGGMEALVRSGYGDGPNVRIVPVEPSQHFIMLDQPARFHALLAEFLAGHR